MRVESHFHDDVVVRLAGFSFAWLRALGAAPDVSVLDARRRLAAAQERAVSSLRAVPFDGLEREHRNAVQKAQRSLADAKTPSPGVVDKLTAAGIDLSAPLAEFEAARTDVKQATERALAAEGATLVNERRELRRWAKDERFREAVFLQSPDALVGVDALVRAPLDATDSQTRQREQLVILFAQRFCAKNDTHSFFGPTAPLNWTKEGGTPFRVSPTFRRKAYLSHWGVNDLGRAFVDRGLSALGVCVTNPTLKFLDGGKVQWEVIRHAGTGMLSRTHREAVLPAEIIALLGACRDGLRTEEIRRDHADLCEGLGELADAGLLLGFPYAVPSGLYHPEEDLLQQLKRQPPSSTRNQALTSVGKLSSIRERFAAAQLPERIDLVRALESEFSAASGTPARRGAGEHYVDRYLIHEEAAADISGNPVTHAALSKLLAVMPHVAALCYLGVWPDRARLRAWFRAHVGAGRPVPIEDVERAIDAGEVAAFEPVPELQTRDEVERRVRSVLSDAIDGRSFGEHAVIPVAALDSALEAVDWSGLDAAYQSVDVLVARTATGEVIPVIGETHGILGAQTFLYDAAADAAAVRERFAGFVRSQVPRGRACELVMLHTQKTDARHPVAELDLEIGANTFRNREQVVRHSAVTVEMDDRGILRLHSPAGDVVPLITTFYYPLVHFLSPVPPAQNDAKDKFFNSSLLPEGGARPWYPRLVTGGVVLRRETWRLGVNDLLTALADPAGLLVGAASLQGRLKLPRHVFVGIPGEPKPIFLDLHSPLLLAVVRKLASRVSAAEFISVSEMLPGADELSLEGPDGPRTFELRTSVFSHPVGH